MKKWPKQKQIENKSGSNLINKCKIKKELLSTKLYHLQLFKLVSHGLPVEIKMQVFGSYGNDYSNVRRANLLLSSVIRQVLQILSPLILYTLRNNAYPYIQRKQICMYLFSTCAYFLRGKWLQHPTALSLKSTYHWSALIFECKQ